MSTFHLFKELFNICAGINFTHLVANILSEVDNQIFSRQNFVKRHAQYVL